MDKSWILLRNRALPEYLNGVEQFLNFAFSNPNVGIRIQCPCTNCNHVRRKTREEVKIDILRWGIDPTYNRWIHHGESDSSSDDEINSSANSDLENDDATTFEMLHDMYHGVPTDNITHDQSDESAESRYEEPNAEAKSFYRLLKDAEQKLYPDCEKFSKLSFVMRLFQMKCLHSWSNTSLDSLLKLLSDVFPKGHVLPNSIYEVQKIIKDLGLDYVKIDACINNCILYRKEYADLEQCPKCGEKRWIVRKGENDDNEVASSKLNKRKKGIPRKILRYFPLIPRLQRLFMTKRTAENMRWHKNKRVDDGVLRHPADSLTWKTFDEKHLNFASDPRNVRLGLASDGFNPFGSMSNAYSMWPVFLIPYNLPPWKCMKQSNILLSLLIPGPKSPGMDIDVYLQPLVDDLKKLWEDGIETYDAFKQQNFQLRASLLWTINDFPAYAMLSGWSTKGKFACPVCHINTCSIYLKYGRKHCYMGHRRFLEINHPYRRTKSSFDNTREERPVPQALSGDDVLAQLNTSLQGSTGDNTRKRKRDAERRDNWKKKSIFFELPYWRTVLLRHNLDVMHIEKNISESVIGTLLDIDGKTKDTLKSRLDIQEMRIKKPLHPIKCGDKYILPPASYTMSKTEKIKFCQLIKDVKFPDAYASNISRCVNVKEARLFGLKSHDHHVIFQRIFPLIIKGILPKDAYDPLIELSLFFSDLCAKELHMDKLDKIDKSIRVTICKLERIFLPSFFDVMVHLAIHLAKEAKEGGPVQFRWMYFIERMLRTLKGYVRNMARPEGSIAEGYLAEECMAFCSKYLTDMETKENRPDRNSNSSNMDPNGLSVFNCRGKPFGGGDWTKLNDLEIKQAHFYILQNCAEIGPFIEEHLEILTKENSRNVAKRHKEEFPLWFQKKVIQLKDNGDSRITDQLLALARGPDLRVECHNGYVLNGFRFRTMASEKFLKTQNSGVVVKSDEYTENADYYGKIRRILEIQYLDKNSVTLFQCDWFEVPPQGRSQSRGYQRDEYGFICVDVTRLHYINDPFILGSQAQSVYYVKHDQNENWNAVVRVRLRNLYDLPEQDDETEPYQLTDLVEREEQNLQVESDTDMIRIQREDIDGLSVEAPSLNNEEEIDLEVVDESDHEDRDDSTDEEYFSEDEHDEKEDDDWL
ncbi:uncharacterized protein LOC107793551 [Nicotiana tabacum]|uniref:Uncharacterized protein LOC107793551 n=1 Tax=Nicotiana tabacum TaxID=4097 RepID=A0A1S4A478_TOBAC